MKCPACEAELPADAAFCHKCGVSLAAPLSAAAPVDRPKVRRGASLPMAARDPGDDAEDVIWQGQFSKFAMLGAWIAGGAFTIAVIVAGVLAGFTQGAWLIAGGVIVLVWAGLILRLFYLQLSLHYYLTNQRFIHEHGLLWRDVDRIETIDIDDVAVKQGPVERMLGIGSILLRSSDASTPEYSIQGIEDVRRVATLIDEARRKERRRRGMYIESV